MSRRHLLVISAALLLGGAGPSACTTADSIGAPRITPVSLPPQLLNRDAVAQALAREAPNDLGQAGAVIGAWLWVFVDETGKVVRSEIAQSSGHEAFDEAALRVVEQMRFRSAQNDGIDVGVWVRLPLRLRYR